MSLISCCHASFNAIIVFSAFLAGNAVCCCYINFLNFANKNAAVVNVSVNGVWRHATGFNTDAAFLSQLFVAFRPPCLLIVAAKSIIVSRVLKYICLRSCGIRSVLWTVTDSGWRHFYFCSTSVFSALEVSYENALYKFAFVIDIDTVFF